MSAIIVPCAHCATANRLPRERLHDAPTCGRCGKPVLTGKPLTLTRATFDRHARGSDLPLLVDFWADWCGPCRQMAPVFEAAAQALEPELRLGKLDTEAEPEIAARFAIRSIPSLLLLSRGREVARTAGAMPLGALIAWARQAASAATAG